MLRRLAGGASVILCRQTIGPGRSGSAPLRRTPIWPLYIRQYRTIPALRLKHRSGSCGTASALPKCSIMSGCGTRIVLRGQKPLALCDRCPCFGSLFPPLAALTFAASSIICAFGLASAAPRSPYRHLELCGIALISKSRRKPHIQLLTSTSYRLTDFQVLSIMRMAAKSCSKLQRDVSSPRRQAKKLVSSST